MSSKFRILKKLKARDRTKANDSVRKSLAAYGDDGMAIRHVVHYAYPADGADLSIRGQIILDLQSQGFAVCDAAAKNGLVLEHHRGVGRGEFDAFTDQLEGWFRDRGWDYDGWECAVVDKRSIN